MEEQAIEQQGQDKKKKKKDPKFKYYVGIVMRSYPSYHQMKIIKHCSDASRFIYNTLVALSKRNYEINKLLSDDSDAELTDKEIDLLRIEVESNYQKIGNPTFIKKATKWLREDKNVDSLALYAARDDYRAAWNMFRLVHSAGTPKFHKKNHAWRYRTSFVNGNLYFVDNKHVKVPKLGIIRVKNARKDILGHDDIGIVSATMKKDSSGYFTISLMVGSNTPFGKELEPNNNAVGVDLNLENFITTSNGDVVDNPRFYRKSLDKMRRQQCAFSHRLTRAKAEHRNPRKAKNLNKARRAYAKTCANVRNQRKNFLDNLSTDLIKNHDFIALENLKGKNMLKNYALAMSVSDAGWRTFITMLQNKGKLYDRKVVLVNPRLTTQTCSSCGYVLPKENRLTLRDREWTCPECHHFHKRDVNASKNILAKAIKKSATVKKPKQSK